MELNINILVSDIINSIALLSPLDFLGVNKHYQNYITNAFVNGIIPIPKLTPDKLSKLIVINNLTIFVGLVKAFKLSEYDSMKLIANCVRYEQYEKAEFLAKDISLSLCNRSTFIATTNIALKYYELYGISDIKIYDNGDIIGTKWIVSIQPCNFLPILPYHLVDELFSSKQYNIFDNWYVGNRRLFKSSTPERIYRIFQYCDLLHPRIFMRLLRIDGLEYVEKLIKKSIKVGTGYDIVTYLYTFAFDSTNDLIHPELSIVRNCMISYMQDPELYEEDLNIDYGRLVVAWNKYIVDRNNYINEFIDVFDSYFNHDSHVNHYEMFDIYEVLMLWCVNKHDLILANRLLNNPHVKVMFGCFNILKHNAIRVESLFKILTIGNSIDDLIKTNIPCLRCIIMEIVLIIYGKSRWDLLEVINKYKWRAHPVTCEYINDILNVASLAKGYRGVKYYKSFRNAYSSHESVYRLGSDIVKCIFNRITAMRLDIETM
jgi:hypothetical protein